MNNVENDQLSVENKDINDCKIPVNDISPGIKRGVKIDKDKNKHILGIDTIYLEIYSRFEEKGKKYNTI